MKINLGPNSDALAISRRLGNTQKTLSDINERLTTGLRILKSSDDAAGQALADQLKNSKKVYTESVKNINSGVELFSVADSALESIDDILTGIQAIAAEATSESIGYEKRQALENELQGLLSEFARIKSDTNYNQRDLINSTNQSVNLQTGATAADNITGSLPEFDYQFEESNPTGQLDAATSLALTGASADGLELYDVDNDGHLDAVTSGSAGGNITILLGNGDGSFSAPVTYSNGLTNFSNDLADFNNDGKVDIITTGYIGSGPFDGRTLLYEGDGSGNFTLRNILAAESSVSFGSEALDINRDGFVDIITSGRTDAGTGQISIRYGNGTFANFSTTSTTIYVNEVTTTRDIKFGDVNSDGLLDMVSAGYTAGSGKFSIRMGNTSGTFGAATTYSSDISSTFSLELADVNNDNILDVITGGRNNNGPGTGSTAVALGNYTLIGDLRVANGTFQNAQIYTQAGGFNPIIKLADLDEDGNSDLVTTGNGGGVGNISVRYGDGTGAFGARTDFAVGTQANNISIADINEDGAKDVVSVSIKTGAASLNINFGQIEQRLLDLEDISVLNVDLATEALEVSTIVKDLVETERGQIEAFLSRLESTIKDSATKSVNFDHAEFRIRDYDQANKATKITRLEIISDSATAVLAQANQDPGRVLALIQTSTNFESKKDK